MCVFTIHWLDVLAVTEMSSHWLPDQTMQIGTCQLLTLYDYIKPEQLSSFTNSCLGAAYEKQSILCKHRVICEWTLKNTSSEELIDFWFKCHSISPLIGKH